MKKNILLTLLLLTSIKASDDWALWTTASTEIKFHDHIKADFELENRFENDIRKYHYAHAQWQLLFRAIGENYLGFNYRHIYTRSSSDKWDEEIRPTLVMTNKLEFNYFPISTRVKLYHRIREGNENRTAVRGRLGIDLIDLKDLTIFADDELFFHHNGLDQFDRNRFTFGVKGSIGKSSKKLAWKFFYRRQSDKSSQGTPWRGFNIAGIALGGKF